MKKFFKVVLLLSSSSTFAAEAEFEAEAGAIGIINHTIRFSKDGTLYDLRNAGEQKNLYPFYRFMAKWRTDNNNYWNFLYQPLEIKTSTIPSEDIRFDSEVFEAGKPIDISYGFPFYRISYLSAINDEWHWGGGLQIRNANIEIRNAEGTQQITRRDIGPVPLLALQWSRVEEDGFKYGFDIHSMYAPIKVLNGSDSDVVGAFHDISMFVGKNLSKDKALTLKVRYLGGGASGTSDDKQNGGDGYSSNWIDATSFSLGIYSFGI